jgi:hypothetical protein
MLYGHIKDNGLLELKMLRERKEVRPVEVKDETTGKVHVEIIERVITIEEQAESLEKEGWKPADEMDTSGIECGENETVKATFYDAGDRISYTYEKAVDTIKVQRKIDDLKQQLADSDYKVIKSYESSLLNQPIPYDIEVVHTKRQSVRDEINRLEGLL